MPVFECARCNALRYSASRAAGRRCDNCGATRLRVLEDHSFSAAQVSPRFPAPGDHCMGIHRGVAEGAALAAAFLEPGLRAGEPTAAQVPDAMREELEQRLPAELSERVRWLEMPDLRSMEDAAALAASQGDVIRASAKPLWIVVGVAPAIEQQIDARERERYERLMHEQVVEHGAVALCLYDASVAASDQIEAGRASHPLVADRSGVHRNPDFRWRPEPS